MSERRKDAGEGDLLHGRVGVWVIKLAGAGLLLFFSIGPVMSQEVVVFKDHRSLAVSRHWQAGAWTHFVVAGGEMAVCSDLILEIRNEGNTLSRSPSAQEPTAPVPDPKMPSSPQPSQSLSASSPPTPQDDIPPPITAQPHPKKEGNGPAAPQRFQSLGGGSGRFSGPQKVFAGKKAENNRLGSLPPPAESASDEPDPP